MNQPKNENGDISVAGKYINLLPHCTWDYVDQSAVEITFHLSCFHVYRRFVVIYSVAFGNP